MKVIVAFVSTLFLYNICFSKTDTIRVYVYLKSVDSWRLEVRNNKTFLLYNNLITTNDFTAKGPCIITDTTYQFLCDTSKLKNKYLSKDIFKQFSNIPYILTGVKFKKQGTFFIPYNINYQVGDSIAVPKGIFARYYTGDRYGSNIIELKKDNTYTFYDNSCEARFTEEGTWSLDKGVVTFIPAEKKWSMLEWITKNRKLYLTDDFLIGKKIVKTYTSKGKSVVTETYSYLSKLPEYL